MTPSGEDLLRARLREVDDLQPPDNGFEMRVLRAGRERQQRRRSWTRGLVGAAAAVAVGALAVPALGRPGQDGVSTGSSAAAGGSAGSKVAAPQGAEGAGPGQDLSSPSSIPARGGTPFDWDSPEGSTGIDAARTALSSPAFADRFTRLTVDRAATPPALVVHMTQYDETAMATVAAQFPPGVPIAFSRSAYSARTCSTTLLKVEGERTSLPDVDGNISDTSCDPDGRVVVTMAPGSTPEQQVAVQNRYGDAVVVQRR